MAVKYARPILRKEGRWGAALLLGTEPRDAITSPGLRADRGLTHQTGIKGVPQRGRESFKVRGEKGLGKVWTLSAKGGDSRA